MLDSMTIQMPLWGLSLLLLLVSRHASMDQALPFLASYVSPFDSRSDARASVRVDKKEALDAVDESVSMMVRASVKMLRKSRQHASTTC